MAIDNHQSSIDWLKSFVDVNASYTEQRVKTSLLAAIDTHGISTDISVWLAALKHAYAGLGPLYEEVNNLHDEYTGLTAADDAKKTSLALQTFLPQDMYGVEIQPPIVPLFDPWHFANQYMRPDEWQGKLVLLVRAKAIREYVRDKLKEKLTELKTAG